MGQWRLYKFPSIWGMYCPPHLMWVSTLPWQKWIVKFPRVQQPVLILFSQNLLCSRSRHCTCEWVHIEDNSSSSCLSCLVLLVFLTLFFFNFLNFMLTVWTTAFIGCVVWFCYNVEELRSRYDAKLQRVFLTFFSVVFLQKFQNWVWKRKKSFVEIKPVSVVEHVKIWQFIFTKLV